MLFNLLLMTSL